MEEEEEEAPKKRNIKTKKIISNSWKNLGTIVAWGKTAQQK